MHVNKRLIVIIIVVLLLLLGLAGLWAFLAGGSSETPGQEKPAAEVGLVHVRTIYMANGMNLALPTGIGSDAEGNFFVTLRDAAKVIEFERDGDAVRVWGEKGLAPGQMMVATGVAIDRLAGRVYVTDRSRLRLIAYDTRGVYQWEVPILNPLAPVVTKEGIAVLTFGPVALFDQEGRLITQAGTRGLEVGQLDYPRAGAALGDGSLVVADTNNCRVQRIRIEGEVTATALWVEGEPPRFQDDPQTLFGVPSGVAVDEKGRAFVLDGFRYKIAVLDTKDGKVLHTFELTDGTADGTFHLPTGIAYLGDRTFAVTDTYNDRVQIIRLLLPEENTVIARYPWLAWLLLPLALLPIAWLLWRRRVHATATLLDRAAADERLRLLVGAFKRIGVLAGVYERYAEVEERDVAIGPFLRSIGASDASEAAEIVELIEASRIAKRGLAGLGRRVFLVADEQEATLAREAGARRVMTYEEICELYALEEE